MTQAAVSVLSITTGKPELHKTDLTGWRCWKETYRWNIQDWSRAVVYRAIWTGDCPDSWKFKGIDRLDEDFHVEIDLISREFAVLLRVIDKAQRVDKNNLWVVDKSVHGTRKQE